MPSCHFVTAGYFIGLVSNNTLRHCLAYFKVAGHDRVLLLRAQVFNLG